MKKRCLGNNPTVQVVATRRASISSVGLYGPKGGGQGGGGRHGGGQGQNFGVPGQAQAFVPPGPGPGPGPSHRHHRHRGRRDWGGGWGGDSWYGYDYDGGCVIDVFSHTGALYAIFGADQVGYNQARLSAAAVRGRIFLRCDGSRRELPV